MPTTQISETIHLKPDQRIATCLTCRGRGVVGPSIDETDLRGPDDVPEPRDCPTCQGRGWGVR